MNTFQLSDPLARVSQLRAQLSALRPELPEAAHRFAWEAIHQLGAVEGVLSVVTTPVLFGAGTYTTGSKPEQHIPS